jgi:hypothetical protein
VSSDKILLNRGKSTILIRCSNVLLSTDKICNIIRKRNMRPKGRKVQWQSAMSRRAEILRSFVRQRSTPGPNCALRGHGLAFVQVASCAEFERLAFKGQDIAGAVNGLYSNVAVQGIAPHVAAWPRANNGRGNDRIHR